MGTDEQHLNRKLFEAQARDLAEAEWIIDSLLNDTPKGKANARLRAQRFLEGRAALRAQQQGESA